MAAEKVDPLELNQDAGALKWWETGFFALVFAYGVFMFLGHLELHSLWGDELCTWMECWQPNFSAFWAKYASYELTPPLYFLAEFAVGRVLPASEFSVRILSVIFGFGIIAASGLFAYRLSGQKRAGLAAAAFVATSYRALLMAREARAYALLSLLSALSGWAWLNIDFSAPSFRQARARTYIILAVLISYTHHFGVLMVMAQGLSVFFWPLSRARLKNWIFTYGLIVLFYIPCLLGLVLHHTTLESHIDAPPWSELFVATRELFGSSSINSIYAFLLAAVAIFAVRSASDAWRKRAAVLSWVFLVFFIALLISQAKAIYSTRYYLVVLSPLLVVSAVGCFELVKNSRLLQLFAVAIFCIFGIYETIVGREYLSKPQTEQVREAVQVAVEYLKEDPDADLSIVQFSAFTTDIYMQRFGSNRRIQHTIYSMDSLLHPASWEPSMHAIRKLIILTVTYDDRNFEKMYASFPPTMKLLKRHDFYHISTAEIDVSEAAFSKPAQ